MVDYSAQALYNDPGGRQTGPEKERTMFTSKLSKQEIIDKIVEERAMLSRFADNAKDPAFREYEQIRADYLKMLVDALGITEEGA